VKYLDDLQCLKKPNTSSAPDIFKVDARKNLQCPTFCRIDDLDTFPGGEVPRDDISLFHLIDTWRRIAKAFTEIIWMEVASIVAR